MKKILKENKAITLIALVITIVVLIILAGVLINLTLGENGIFTRAKKAKKDMEDATIKENIQLAYAEALTARLAGEEIDVAKNIQDNLEKIYGEGNVTVIDSGGESYTIQIKGKTFSIDGEGTANKKTGIVLLTKKTKVRKNQTKTLVATLTDSTANIIWSSSNSSIVSVTSSGEIQGVGNSGSATITATVEGTGYYDTCIVDIAQTITSISPNAVSIVTGETQKIEIGVQPNGIVEDITYTYESRDTDIATVNSKGQVTGISQGEVIIDITGTTESNVVLNATCEVNVLKPSGYFKTINGVAYYYPTKTATTGTAITASNLGNYIGMEVDYTPYSKFTKYATSDTYRLLYVDLDGKYGTVEDGNGPGTIYLMAGNDNKEICPKNISKTNKSGVDALELLNPQWAEAYSTSTNDNATYTRNMLDYGIWAGYTDTGDLETCQIAKYAVGAPSIELWADAYNIFLEHNPVEGYEPVTYTVYLEGYNNSGKGYYIGTNGLYRENDKWRGAKKFVKSSCYPTGSSAAERVKVFIDNTNVDISIYWLSSPWATWANLNAVVCPRSDKITYSRSDNYIEVLCPVICIKHNVAINLKNTD